MQVKQKRVRKDLVLIDTGFNADGTGTATTTAVYLNHNESIDLALFGYKDHKVSQVRVKLSNSEATILYNQLAGILGK